VKVCSRFEVVQRELGIIKRKEIAEALLFSSVNTVRAQLLDSNSWHVWSWVWSIAQ